MSETTITSGKSLREFDLSMLEVSVQKHLVYLESVVRESDSIVHDINNQLAAIIALSDILDRTKDLDEKIQSKIGRILESSKNIAVLTEKWEAVAKGQVVSGLVENANHDISSKINYEAEDTLAMGKDAKLEKSKHILLVDDEEVVCMATQEMLKRLDYDVTTMNCGADAIEYYEENWHGIDLVVLDMMMPEMGGEEVFGHLQRINPDANVLVSSGYSGNDKARDLEDMGAKGYIQKPYRLAELSSTVRQILNQA